MCLTQRTQVQMRLLQRLTLELSQEHLLEVNKLLVLPLVQTARIIDTTSPMSYVLEGGFGATDFTTSDTITGTSSGATAPVSSVTAGSKVITSSFTLDTGHER